MWMTPCCNLAIWYHGITPGPHYDLPGHCHVNMFTLCTGTLNAYIIFICNLFTLSVFACLCVSFFCLWGVCSTVRRLDVKKKRLKKGKGNNKQTTKKENEKKIGEKKSSPCYQTYTHQFLSPCNFLLNFVNFKSTKVRKIILFQSWWVLLKINTETNKRVYDNVNHTHTHIYICTQWIYYSCILLFNKINILWQINSVCSITGMQIKSTLISNKAYQQLCSLF